MSADTSQLVYQYLASGKYLSALHLLRQNFISFEQAPHVANLLMWTLNAVDPWDTGWSFIEDYQLRDRRDQRLQASLSEEAREVPSFGDLVEPEGPIAAALTDHRVVIIMESHRAPETRYFGTQLLRALKAAGATHFAFETAAQLPLDKFARTGILRPDTEVYAFDPSRASLLRIARELGLKLVAFDFSPKWYMRTSIAQQLQQRLFTAENVNRERERSMAENIVRLIIRRDPAARVVVWTGEQHAMKRTPPNWGPGWSHPFMAAHLVTLMDEDPFCVWQSCVDMPALYAEPLLLQGEHAWLRERGVNVAVLHHRGPTPMRPAWLDQGKVPVNISTEGAELIQAIPAQEGPEAVPVAQWLTSEPQIQALLPPGDYLLRQLHNEDELISELKLSVY
jgi:hypothetical protein